MDIDPDTHPCRLATLLALGVVMQSCSGDSTEPAQGAPMAPSVLFITLDTTRRDAMGFHGQSPTPTPHLDRLAEESVVFDDAYTVAPLTLPAHSSLMTGLYPVSHGVRENSVFRLAEEADTLAEILQSEGYATAASVAAFVLEADFGIAQGFDKYRAPPRIPGTSVQFMAEVRADRNVDHALQDLATLPAPFFYWLHLFDPHFPYEAPGATPSSTVSTPEQEKQRYLEEVRFADRQLGRLFDRLRQQDLWERLIVVFASDHGESLGDAKEATHGHFVYDPTMRIPLLLRAPSVKPQRVEEGASLIDVVPTVLSLLDIPRPDLRFDGIDWTGPLSGQHSVPERVIALESYNVYYNHGFAPFECIVRGTDKFIHSRVDEFYDRQADPTEQHNAIGDAGSTVQAMTSQLEQLFSDPPHAIEQSQRVLSEEDRQQLEALGYLAGEESRSAERPDIENLPNALDKLEILEQVDEVSRQLMEDRPLDALESLRRLVKLEPQSALFHERLGVLLLLHQANALDEAQFHLEEAIRLHFHRAKAHFNLGLCYLTRATLHRRDAQQKQQQGDLPAAETAIRLFRQWVDRALQEFRIVTDIEPGYPEALMNIADIAYRQAQEAKQLHQTDRARKSSQEAIQALTQFLEVVPQDHPDWAKFEPRLRAWKSEAKLLNE